MWSHSAQLIVAAPISDSLLADELRRLGTSYGIQIQSFNLSLEKLEEMPYASKILALSDSDFENLLGKFTPSFLSTGVLRPTLDWDHIQDMMIQSRTFLDIFDWIARCLRDSRSYNFSNYINLREIEQKPG